MSQLDFQSVAFVRVADQNLKIYAACIMLKFIQECLEQTSKSLLYS